MGPLRVVNGIDPDVASNTDDGLFDIDQFCGLNSFSAPTEESFGVPTGIFPTPRVTTFDTSGLDWAKMIFRLVPRTGSPTVRPAWAAKMAVRCEDIEELLRDGFAWDNDNFIHRESSVRYDLALEWLDRGFRNLTTWVLADRPGPGGGSPRWFARIEVITADFHDLYAFHVHRLSWQNICGATAYAASSSIAVYHFDRNAPGDNFNVVTWDPKPMSCEWPWPERKAAPPADPQMATLCPLAATDTTSSGSTSTAWPSATPPPAAATDTTPRSSSPTASPSSNKRPGSPSHASSPPEAKKRSLPNPVSAPLAANSLPGQPPTPVDSGQEQTPPPAAPPPRPPLKRPASPPEPPRPAKRMARSVDGFVNGQQDGSGWDGVEGCQQQAREQAGEVGGQPGFGGGFISLSGGAVELVDELADAFGQLVFDGIEEPDEPEEHEGEEVVVRGFGEPGGMALGPEDQGAEPFAEMVVDGCDEADEPMLESEAFG